MNIQCISWLYDVYTFSKSSVLAGCNSGFIFKRSLTGLNSEVSLFETSCHTQVKEPRLPYSLSVSGRRVVGFIPCPKVWALCEMQTASSNMWTRVAVSISNSDNHYTMCSTVALRLECMMDSFCLFILERGISYLLRRLSFPSHLAEQYQTILTDHFSIPTVS